MVLVKLLLMTSMDMPRIIMKSEIMTNVLNGMFLYPKYQFFHLGKILMKNFRLGKFIQLAPPNHKHALDAIWGRLASAICSEQFDAAHEAMTQLRENIDQTGKKFFANRVKLLQTPRNRIVKKSQFELLGRVFFLFQSIHIIRSYLFFSWP